MGSDGHSELPAFSLGTQRNALLRLLISGRCSADAPVISLLKSCSNTHSATLPAVLIIRNPSAVSGNYG